MSNPKGSASAPALAFRHAVLSNGCYGVILSTRGTGRSWCDDVAVNHWSADRVGDEGGIFVAVRDADSGSVWNAAGDARDGVQATVDASQPGVVTFSVENDGIATTLSCCVDPDRNAEVRRLTLTNGSDRPRRIEVAAWFEAVLATVDSFEAHPTFSKLFLQTDREAAIDGLVVSRRARGDDETHPVLGFALDGPGTLDFETDRTHVVGRGHTLRDPLFLRGGDRLPGSTGNVLDPCPCLRRAVEVAPGERVEWTGLLAIAADRRSTMSLLREATSNGDVFDRARRHAEAAAESAGIDHETALRLQALAVATTIGDPRLVPAQAKGRVDRDRGTPAVAASNDARAEVSRALRYWEALGLPARLVEADGPTAPRLVVDGPLQALDPALRSADASAPPATHDAAPTAHAALPHNEELQFENGYGGFSADGREYVIRLHADAHTGLRRPPRPWSNVLANPDFGVQVSEAGALCTWKGNSRLFRLTPWRNDPLIDPHDETFHLIDETSGDAWSALPGPLPAGNSYEVRHGIGSTRFRHRRGDLEVEATVHVPTDAPVRVMQIRLRNHGGVDRKLAATAHANLVLGDIARESSRHVTVSACDGGTLLARSRENGPFADEIAFASAATDAPDATLQVTGDRRACLGEGGDVRRPAMLAAGEDLEARFGPGLESCFAHRLSFTLPAGHTVTCVFVLGAAPERETIDGLIVAHGRVASAADSLQRTMHWWATEVGGIQVQTPSPALDLMVNGWLQYQTLSCRMWGRTATYQSGGAFGFRDQLQDSTAFLTTNPARTREQIVLHASHQFEEGDVLHWWHPPHDEGIRTRFADDLLWLPYVTLQYLEATGDDTVLQVDCPFLTAAMLAPGEDEVYLRPAPSGDSGSVFEHCCRAIDRSMALGAHGLPLFGTGDWNDGMNRVGREGRGESVWMAFFLIGILDGFADLCEARNDTTRAERYRAHRLRLIEAVNDAGWDGAWYRRGFYDDGSPLGSRNSDECRIDALAQAWSVLSGAAPLDRARQAMQALETKLVSRDEGLIRLLTPPFHVTKRDPGYIKGYVQGVRENGGQYTHAALWVIRAYAELGRRDRVAELLDLINPVHHARDPREVATYQLEPYVVAADVYGAAPHVGRGGWSWYTGSAGWMYRVAVESLLGLRLSRGNELRLRPCLPEDWPEVTIQFRLPESSGSTLRIVLRQFDGVGPSVSVSDGVEIVADGREFRIALPRDGRSHEIVLPTVARREAAS